MLRSTTPPCPHHVPDNFITFHFRAPGRNDIVSAPFVAMEFPCLVNEHWDSSCPIQFCVGHTQAHTQAQEAHSSSPNFLFFFSSCSLSTLFLFCEHAVQKKLNYFKCHEIFVIFFLLQSSLRLAFLAEIILLCTCTKVLNTCE